MDHLTNTLAPAPDPQSGPSRSRLFRSRTERAAAAAVAEARAAAAGIETARAHAQIEHERLENERELLKLRAELDAERQRLVDQQAARLEEKLAKARQQRWDSIRRFGRRLSLAVVLAGANVGVNAAAVLGQVLALCIGLGWRWWAAIPLALVVESVAVNVGYFAHDKLIKGYSAFWLRLLSYGIGAGVGWFNYTHNAAHQITADFAGVFGACSLLSPVLWQIYSQWRHWDEMRSQELLEARAPKFPWARRILWPGETLFIYRRAVRHGVQSVAEADARFRPEYERTRKTKQQPEAEPAEHAAAGDKAVEDLRNFDPRAAVRRSLRRAAAVVGPLAPAATDLPAPRPVAEQDAAAATTPATARMTMDEADDLPPSPYGSALARTPWVVGRLVPLPLPPRPVLRPAGQGPVRLVAGPGGLPMAVAEPEGPRPGDDPGRDRKLPTDKDRRRWVQAWINRAAKGEVWSKRELAKRSTFSETWALERIREAREQMITEGWTFDADGRPVRPVAEAVGSGATGGPV